MALVAGALIEAARDRSPAFVRTAHPDAVALRALSRRQRELVAWANGVNPDAALVPLTFELPLEEFSAGVEIPPHHYVRGGSAYHGAHARPLHLISEARRLDPPTWPAVYMLNGRLHLVGRARDWQGLTSVMVMYVPIPEDLTSLGSALVLPDSAEAALVAGVAAFLAGRTTRDEGVHARAVQAEWEAARDGWLSEIGGRRRAHTSTIREVW